MFAIHISEQSLDVSYALVFSISPGVLRLLQVAFRVKLHRRFCYQLPYPGPILIGTPTFKYSSVILVEDISGGSRIFTGAPTLGAGGGGAGIKFNFPPPPEYCMKLRTIWPLGAPPPDPPLDMTRHSIL